MSRKLLTFAAEAEFYPATTTNTNDTRRGIEKWVTAADPPSRTNAVDGKGTV